jgi:hypothetical protein
MNLLRLFIIFRRGDRAYAHAFGTAAGRFDIFPAGEFVYNIGFTFGRAA